MSGFIGGISTSFTIEDRATSSLMKISEGLERVQGVLGQAMEQATAFSEVRFGGITRSLGALVDRLDQAAVAAERLSMMRFGDAARSVRNLTDATEQMVAAVDSLPASFGSAMSRIVGETDRAMAAMRGLQAEMQATSAAAAGIGGGGGGFAPPPRGGGGVGRAARTAGGIYSATRPTYMYTLGGHAESAAERGMMRPLFHGPGVGALAAGYAGFKGIEWGLEYDQALSLAVTQMGEDPSSSTGQRMRKNIAETVHAASARTTFAEKDVAPGMAQLYPMLAAGVSGTPEERSAKLSGLMAEITKFSEFETKYVHQGTMETNAVAGARIAHQLKLYEPDQISKILNKIRVMSAMTETSPQAFASTLKYSELAGQIAGGNPMEILEDTGFLLQTMSGSTPGTGLANLYHEILAGEAPTEAGRQHLASARKQASEVRQQFERALKGETGIGAVVEHAAHGGPKEKAGAAALRRLGLTGADHQLLPQFIDPETGLWKEREMLRQLHDDFEKRGRASGIDLDLALKQRGSRIVAPFLGTGWNAFENFDEGRRQAERMSIDQAQGAMAATPMGQVQQAWARFEDFMTKFVTTGEKGSSLIDSLGAAAEKTAHALEGWTSWMDTHKLGGSPDEFLQGPHDIMHGRGKGPAEIGTDIWNWLTGKGYQPFHPGDPEKSEHGVRLAPHMPPTGPTFGPQMLHKESFNTGGGVQVHIQNVSFGGGTPREHADQFAHHLQMALSRAQLNDLSPGGGYSQSPYTTGRNLSV